MPPMRQTVISAWAATVTSVAFQISLAVWPNALQSYAWGVKYIWYLAILLWLVAGAIFIKEKIGSKPPELPRNEIAKAAVTNSGNSSSTATGGMAKVDVHVYPAEAKSTSPVPVQPVQHAAPKQPKYNFHVCDAYPVMLIESGDGFDLVEHPQYYRGFGQLQKGLVVEITNRPHKDGTDFAANVMVEMVARNYQIGPLVWHGPPRSDIDFSHGEPHILFLAVESSRHRKQWVIPRRSTRSTEHGYKSLTLDQLITIDVDDEVMNLVVSSRGRIIHEQPIKWSWSKEGNHPVVQVMRPSE